MSENFSINPNFTRFDNTINDFNKSFSTSLNQANKGLGGAQSFDEIYNSMSSVQNTIAPIKGEVSQFIGMDAINAQKFEISPTAKMAQDIGKGFANGLGQVSEMNKQAEEAFETFASGGDISVHEVMIASQKSGLAMQMAIQLRNQMINAYNEFKNMGI